MGRGDGDKSGDNCSEVAAVVDSDVVHSCRALRRERFADMFVVTTAPVVSVFNTSSCCTGCVRAASTIVPGDNDGDDGNDHDGVDDC
jgi:hypothetical protein